MGKASSIIELSLDHLLPGLVNKAELIIHSYGGEAIRKAAGALVLQRDYPVPSPIDKAPLLVINHSSQPVRDVLNVVELRRDYLLAGLVDKAPSAAHPHARHAIGKRSSFIKTSFDCVLPSLINETGLTANFHNRKTFRETICRIELRFDNKFPLFVDIAIFAKGRVGHWGKTIRKAFGPGEDWLDYYLPGNRSRLSAGQPARRQLPPIMVNSVTRRRLAASGRLIASLTVSKDQVAAMPVTAIGGLLLGNFGRNSADLDSG